MRETGTRFRYRIKGPTTRQTLLLMEITESSCLKILLRNLDLIISQG